MSGSKEDNPTTASKGDYAQSECHCALYSNSVIYPLWGSYLIVSSFQENKSLGASTICIHPLMYGKLFREQFWMKRFSLKFSWDCSFIVDKDPGILQLWFYFVLLEKHLFLTLPFHLPPLPYPSPAPPPLSDSHSIRQFQWFSDSNLGRSGDYTIR
jgi:hypothetical protein